MVSRIANGPDARTPAAVPLAAIPDGISTSCTPTLLLDTALSKAYGGRLLIPDCTRTFHRGLPSRCIRASTCSVMLAFAGTDRLYAPLASVTPVATSTAA